MKKALAKQILAGMFLFVFSGSQYPVRAQTWKGKIIKEGDVTVVQNPKEPMFKGEILTLKEDLRLGGPEARRDYSFNRITTLAVDSQENIFVLDVKDSHVKVFDKSGKYLRTIGRKGQGPGELDGVHTIDFIRQTGALLVLEGSRISSFDRSGNFIKSMPLNGFGNVQMLLDSKGQIYILSFVLGDKETSYIINKFASDLKLIAVMARTPSLIDYSKTNNPFGPLPCFAVDAKDRFLYGFPKSYEIQIFGPDNKQIGRILKEYEPVEVTAEEIEERKKDNPPEIKLKFSQYHPAFRRFYPDDEGRLFVQTFARTNNSQGYIYDVFDAAGRYMGSISLPDRPVLLKNGRLYSLEEDENGYQIIKRYAVIWKAESLNY